jgi:DNA polymerase-3 subunit epsilon
MTVSLADLRILALDCQATGANPQKGHLLELGWMAAGASPLDKSRASGIQAYLNRLPADEKIPRVVSRITGISDESLADAKPSRIIWQHLMDAVEAVVAENQTAVCPTVIHFARFEEPFLKDLHQTIDPESPFPFQSAGDCAPSPVISITACSISSAVPTTLPQRRLSGSR